MKQIEVSGSLLCAESGALTSDVAEYAIKRNLGGLECFFSIPGTVGGAVWMNARCYGVDISRHLESVEYIDGQGKLHKYLVNEKDFSYKKSPFQKMNSMILRCSFRLRPDDPVPLKEVAERCYENRVRKGHFDFPSAGSVFKNSELLSHTSGEILDSFFVRGWKVGDAQVSSLHANIIQNYGNATANEVETLIKLPHQTVYLRTRVKLSREVQFIGEEC